MVDNGNGFGFNSLFDNCKELIIIVIFVSGFTHKTFRIQITNFYKNLNSSEFLI